MMDATPTASKQKNKLHQASIRYEDKDDVSWLLENLLVSSINNAQNQPFSVFLYRIGMLLYEECYKTKKDEDGVQHIEQVYQKWLESLPQSIIETTVLEIIEAFLTLVTNSIQSPSPKMLAIHVLDALSSVCGLFSSSFLACKIINDYKNVASATEFYIALHRLYLKLQSTDLMQDHPFKHQVMTAIQRTISALFLVKAQKILLQRQVEDKQEKEENACFLHILVELSTGDQDGLSLLLQDAIHSEIIITCCPDFAYSGTGVSTRPVKTLREGLEKILQKLSSTDFFGDSEQYVYLLTALLDSRASDFTEQVQYSMMEKKLDSFGLPRTMSTKTDVLSSSFFKKGSKITKNSASSTIDLYIDQIKQIMPHLGDGYIELALECYGWDLETVLSKLLDSPNEALHPRLQSCSTSMPRWKKQQQEEDSINPSEEAKKIQLQHLKALEDQQELDAYILKKIDGENEYDDDYDDQYDDIVGAGDVSGPSTMMDDTYFDQIRRYNAVKRSEENEEKFWVSFNLLKFSAMLHNGVNFLACHRKSSI
jgi:hypothetical protein